MGQYANAVMTKARAMYGQMLSPAQYDDLLRKQNVQEISAYLRDKTPYAAALSGVQDSTVHRGQLENLLHKDMFYQYVRLAKYIRTDQGTYRYVVMDMEIEIILAALRGIISGHKDEFIAGLPAFLQPYASFDIFSLADAKSVEEIARQLGHTPYAQVLLACMKEHPQIESYLNYTAYEFALRCYYFKTLVSLARKTARGKAREDLLEIITTRAELMNITTIHRLKTFFNAVPDRIRPAVLPFTCRLKQKTVDALIEAKDEEAFMLLLSKTPYGRWIEKDTKFIESAADTIRYHMDLKLLRYSTNPQVVFMAFMLLRGMETENIIRIIEGVRYQLAPEKIERLLYRA